MMSANIPARQSTIKKLWTMSKRWESSVSYLYFLCISYALFLLHVYSRLLLLVGPIKFIDANPDQSAKLGSSYKIMCKVEADPSPQVSWSRNGQKLNTNNPQFTFDVDGLTINGVQESDDGDYICEAVVPDTGEYKMQNIRFEVSHWFSRPKFI